MGIDLSSQANLIKAEGIQKSDLTKCCDIKISSPTPCCYWCVWYSTFNRLYLREIFLSSENSVNNTKNKPNKKSYEFQKKKRCCSVLYFWPEAKRSLLDGNWSYIWEMGNINILGFKGEVKRPKKISQKCINSIEEQFFRRKESLIITA